MRSCDAKIKEITGGNVKTIQKKLDDSKKQLEKIKKEMIRLKVEITNGERELHRSQNKVKKEFHCDRITLRVVASSGFF